MKKKLLGAAVAAAFAAGGANAAVTITQAPGSNIGTDNVVFNPCSGIITGPALMVQGCLNNNNSVLVDFTGTENLVVNGGQARIEAEVGTFDNLTINLDPLATSAFTTLIFNINAEQGNPGQITILADVISAADVSQIFNIAQGQNFFHVDATGGDLIRSVNFQSTGLGVLSVAFDDVRQVRIGGPGIVTLPEPGALVLLGTVLGAIGMTARRKKHGDTLAA